MSATYTPDTRVDVVEGINIESILDWAEALGTRDIDVVRDYVETVAEVAADVGLNARAMIAQSIHETTQDGVPWNSYWWRERRNPAGLNITGDSTSDHARSADYVDGVNAALGHLVHFHLYVHGASLPDDLAPYQHLSTSWQRALVHAGTCKRLRDFTGRWATDPAYDVKWAKAHNAMMAAVARVTAQGEEPMSVAVYGRVPVFGYLDRPISKPEGKGWNNLGKRDILGVVLHRMLGSLWGTDGYFRLATVNALTDYGVGVAATDGSTQAGVIIRWNDPTGYRAGWASGPVSAPYGDGLTFVRKYGINAVNRRLVSLEISGNQSTPIDDFAFNEIVHFITYHADQAGISWEEFPYYKVTGMSFLFYHDEFCFGSGKRCPFEYVKSILNRIIAAVKAMLKKYQTGAVSVPAPTPAPTPAPAPSGLQVGDWVAFDGEYNVRRAWNTNAYYNGEANVTKVTTAGEVAKIIGGPERNEGYVWWDVEIPGFGTGHVIANGMTKTAAPAPPPAPEKMWKSPAPVTEIALLDPNTEGDIVLPDGTVLEPIFDLVLANTKGQMKRFAEGEDVIGPDYKPGEEYIAMYRFHFKDRDFLYLSNHARVYAENFDRVSDVVTL